MIRKSNPNSSWASMPKSLLDCRCFRCGNATSPCQWWLPRHGPHNRHLHLQATNRLNPRRSNAHVLHGLCTRLSTLSGTDEDPQAVEALGEESPDLYSTKPLLTLDQRWIKMLKPYFFALEVPSKDPNTVRSALAWTDHTQGQALRTGTLMVNSWFPGPREAYDSTCLSRRPMVNIPREDCNFRCE